MSAQKGVGVEGWARDRLQNKGRPCTIEVQARDYRAVLAGSLVDNIQQNQHRTRFS